MSVSTASDLNASLSSLAMLSLRMRAGKDYLDYLRGFVIDSLRRMKGDPVDAAKLKQDIQEEFGLSIPAATFSIYLKRLGKEGVIFPMAGGLQYQVKSLPETTIASDRAAAKQQISEVTEELAAFAHQKYALKWDEFIASGAIAQFLRKYSIDFLKFSEFKSPLPDASSDNESTAYVVASFITNAAKNKPALFQSVKVLVQSHILSNALLCPDLGGNRGFSGVHFLLDTRFILKALDLESNYDTENAKALVAAIRKLKGVVCVFGETKDELRGVLRAIIRGFQSGSGRGPVYRELLKRGRGVADVILAERNLEAALASLSISTLPSPNYSEDNYTFQIDEAELRDEIDDQVDYISDRAADHDIRVVRNVFALRKGRHVSSIEDATHVFLTTNSALSRAAFQYERKNSKGWIFSAVVTDYHLSHLAWLKSPMEAQDLPHAEILANCYATMRPDESIWNRYIDEVARLKLENKVSEKDHEVLRFSINAPDELMDVTRGDVEGVTPANVHIILEKLERSYAIEKAEKLAQERQEHEETQKKLEKVRAAAEMHSEQLFKAAEREEALKRERAKNEQELDKLRSLEDLSRDREIARAAKIGRIAGIFARLTFVLSGFLFAVIGILALFSDTNRWLGAPAALLGFFNLWTGFSGNTVEEKTRSWLNRCLLRIFN